MLEKYISNEDNKKISKQNVCIQQKVIMTKANNSKHLINHGAKP